MSLLLAGDTLVASSVPAASLPSLQAQGWVHSPGGAGPSLATVLLIVKQAAVVNASLQMPGAMGAAASCALLCVDETTALGPAKAVPVSCTSLPAGAGLTAALTLRPYATCVLTVPLASGAV